MRIIILFAAMIISMVLSIFILSCASNQSDHNDNQQDHFSIENAPPKDKYMIEVAYKVDKTWIFPKNSLCNQNMQTSILLSILPNGEIKKVSFYEKSKCKDLDDSALSAIKRAAPFKPFPENLKVEVVDMGLRFSPKGLK